MASEAGLKRYYGSSLLYQIIDGARAAGQGSYLQRDLRRALDAHNTPSKPAAGRDLHAARKEYVLPDQDALDALRRPDDAQIRVRLGSLQGRALDPVPMPVAQTVAEGPAWMPPPTVIRLKCRITCMLCRGGTMESHSIITRESKSAVLTLDTVSPHRIIKVDMEPFIIDQRELVCQYRQEPKSWHTQLLLPCTVVLQLSCSNSTDAKLLHTLIGSDSDVVSDPKASELFCMYRKLPECPTSRIPLYIRPTIPARQPVALKCMAEVVIAHHASCRTALATYNANMCVTDVERAVTPSKEIRVTYNFTAIDGSCRIIRCATPRCILCPTRPPMATFERLHLHLLLNHDHFEFSVKDTSKGKRINVDLVTKLPRRQGKQDDELSMSWLRPERPFKMAEHLAGDHSWTTGRAPSKRVTAPARMIDARLKDASQVKSLVARKRKRYAVPNVPGVVFYRSMSKRRIEPGEVLSESEDDTFPDGWLVQRRQLRNIEHLDGAENEFVKLLDRHVANEMLIGDLFLSDCLVRFCRQNKETLQEDPMRRALFSKVSQLRLSGLIPAKTEAWCHDTFMNKQTVAKQQPRPVDHDVVMKDADNVERSQSTRTGVQSLAACDCGRVVVSGRGAVFCSRASCPRGAFHSECVGLTTRQSDWLCATCVPDAA